MHPQIQRKQFTVPTFKVLLCVKQINGNFLIHLIN